MGFVIVAISALEKERVEKKDVPQRAQRAQRNYSFESSAFSMSSAVYYALGSC